MQAAAKQDDHIPTSVVDASVTSRRRGCIVAALVYVNPSVKPSVCQLPGRGAFWGGTMCQDIRVNALVGTRSPYSLPFAILPVPARSPFRFIRHWRRSTPNLTRRKADFTWRSHISHCESNISPVRKNGFHRARKRAYSIPSSAVSIASSMFSSFAVSAAANCAFSGWHNALRL